MWVKCYTKGYPLLGIDSTQRAEAMFRDLKHYIATHFPKSKPVIKLLIPFIVPCMEKKYLEREFRCSNKRLRITHENPRYDEALGKASEHVNELGLRFYHETILELEKRRDLLSVTTNSDGESFIQENYQGRLTNGVVVQYSTSCTSCIT